MGTVNIPTGSGWEPALTKADTFPGGAAYARYCESARPDENGDLQPLDLSGYQLELIAGVEGQREGSRGELGSILAVFDDARGGAAQGKWTVFIVPGALELDRRPGDQTNVVVWTVVARRSGREDLVLGNVTLSVSNTALS
ncbi:MAG: hypothetical protein AAFP22_09760 [Planctomycetota bacterium]